MGHRSWVSLLAALFFIVLAATGLALMAHVRLGPLKMTHELAGVAFIVIGVVHLVFNRRCLVSYCRDRRVLVVLAVAVVLCGILVAHAGEMHQRHHGSEGVPARERAD